MMRKLAMDKWEIADIGRGMKGRMIGGGIDAELKMLGLRNAG